MPVPFVGRYIPILLSIVLGYTGINVAIHKREELAALTFPAFLGGKEKHKEKAVAQPGHYKILDTSVIIDGRIADICKSGRQLADVVERIIDVTRLEGRMALAHTRMADLGEIVERVMEHHAAAAAQRVATDSPSRLSATRAMVSCTEQYLAASSAARWKPLPSDAPWMVSTMSTVLSVAGASSRLTPWMAMSARLYASLILSARPTKVA